MHELHLPFYAQGFALGYYSRGWRTTGDELSRHIYAMTSKPSPKDKDILKDQAVGWASWIRTEFLSRNLYFDIIVRALGCKEQMLDQSRPMHLLGEKLSLAIRASFLPTLILKTRVSVSQTELPSDCNTWQRRLNVKDTYAVTPFYATIRHKRILVIDDIKTSGGTLIEIGKCLSKNSTNKMHFLVLGQTSQERNSDMGHFTFPERAWPTDMQA